MGTSRRALIASLASALALAGLGVSNIGPAAAQGGPLRDAARGLIWNDLVPGVAHRCQGFWEVRGRAGEALGCTHGPDAAPAGIDVREARDVAALTRESAALPAPAVSPGTNGDGLPCVGDGTSGYRVEAIYAVPAGTTDRYSSIAPLIRSSYAPFVEWVYLASAQETGGEAHVPFVTTPGGSGSCELVVRHVVLSAQGDDSFSNTVSELKGLGFNRTDRRYMVWMDSNVLCGIGHVYRDSQPGQGNANNGYYTAFGRSDAGCWGYAEAHELMHNLGGVQPDAPHATPGFHCWDEQDQMCYDDDGTGPVTMAVRCAGRDGRLLDCNHDDYFVAGQPPPGTWLGSHWNTYDSRFVARGPLVGPPANVAPTVDAGPDRSVTLGDPASLDGTVSDDGLPAGTLTTTWSKASGPGTVTFGNAGLVDTTATFSVAGSYILRLTASDTALSASDTMTVSVSDPNPVTVTETFKGTFSRKVKTITHLFSSAAGPIDVTTVSPAGPRAAPVTTSVYAPNGALLGKVSGVGTQALSVSGPASGGYRVVVASTKGSYTTTVQHRA